MLKQSRTQVQKIFPTFKASGDVECICSATITEFISCEIDIIDCYCILQETNKNFSLEFLSICECNWKKNLHVTDL